MTETISLKELINLTDDEIRNRNPDEADDYIKARDALKPKIKPVKPKRK